MKNLIFTLGADVLCDQTETFKKFSLLRVDRGRMSFQGQRTGVFLGHLAPGEGGSSRSGGSGGDVEEWMETTGSSFAAA